MPGFDGTGPLGQGPMTGRAMGRCVGNFVNRGGSFGRGFGRGLGRGLGRGFRAGQQAGWFGVPYVPYTPEMSHEDAAQRIEALEAELQTLKEIYENSDNKR
ncbi:MAG: DUF5320 domain-containing protein [Sedimentisphaerales bacterium]|nr:DUF5320 domain-containing protein [Sedimentisphaerales bacterium]